MIKVIQQEKDIRTMERGRKELKEMEKSGNYSSESLDMVILEFNRVAKILGIPEYKRVEDFCP